MEILYIILGFILGGVLAYFIVKSSSVSRKIHDEFNQNFAKEAEFNKILAEISAENKSQNKKLQNNKNSILNKTTK
jgi:DNA recombination protein RmuC